MKLTAKEDILGSYMVIQQIRNEVKDRVVEEAADEKIEVDYSALEMDPTADILNSSSSAEFFNERDIEL